MDMSYKKKDVLLYIKVVVLDLEYLKECRRWEEAELDRRKRDRPKPKNVLESILEELPVVEDPKYPCVVWADPQSKSDKIWWLAMLVPKQQEDTHMPACKKGQYTISFFDEIEPGETSLFVLINIAQRCG